MNREQLYYFVNIVDCGSINKAAQKLYISQPSLSRSMHALEKELGKTLIERSTKGIQITSTGKAMYFYAQSILGQFQMIERLKSLSDDILYSKVSISVSNILLQDDMILELYRELSSADTEISFHETTCEEVLQNVTNRKSEIGITVLNNTQLPVFKRMCELRDIEIETLGTSPLIIHANSHVFPNHEKEINAQQLLPKTYVRLPNDFFANLNTALDIDNVTINSFSKTITSNNYHTIVKMIKNEDAFLLGHKWLVDEFDQTNIKSFFLTRSESIEKYFLIIHRKNEPLSNAGKIFLSLVQKYYKAI